MTTTINGRTPEEIKKGLNHCSEDGCKQCPYKDDCDMADGFSVLAGDANAYIQQLEEKVPKWISVEERLPEFGRYLVITKNDNDVGKVHTATYNDMGWWVLANFGEVTHWMPLPEPQETE